jgi:hypothetical protein
VKAKPSLHAGLRPRRPRKKPEAKPEVAAAPKAPAKRVRKAPAKVDGADGAAKEGKE